MSFQLPRKESAIVTSCLKWLQIQENIKRISWVDRCNSGSFKSKDFYARGHRAGTADLFIITLTGITIWMEVKKDDKQKLRPSQLEFKERMNKIPNHKYIVISSLDEMLKCLHPFGI